MEDVHALTLVLMETFYLHIEDGTRIHVDAVVLLDILGKAQLVMVLDVHELLLASCIVCVDGQLLNMGQITDPLVADLIRHPVCKKRVSMKEEPSLGNAVCLVVELLRHHLIEVPKLLLFQNLRVKPCNAVYREAAHDGKVCHPHLSVVDDCHLADLLVIAGIQALDLFHEPAVDLLHDLINTRKQAGEQLNRPFLQSLGHDRVVRVSAGLRGDLPCLIPLQMLFVHQNPHELGHGHARMGVVHLEDCLLVEFMDVVMFFLIFFHSPLDAGGDEEILLL